MDGNEAAKAVFWLGETLGFWIQSGAFIITAVGAVAIIYNNSHQAKKRATIDLVLHESQNPILMEAKKQVSKYHDTKVNFTELSCGEHCLKPENGFIQIVLNNYEFTAAGIKEGAFDEKIYKRTKYSLILRDWNAFSGYIAELRRAKNRNTLYMEFEWLAKRWGNRPIPNDINFLRKSINWIGL